jgi:acylphosphatase
MKAAKRFVVRGRVQGVGYRYFAVTCAQALGVCGWARNTPEGAVEVHAEGDEEQLRSFAFDLSRGPRYARVSQIDAQDVSLEGHTDFRASH